MKSQRIDLLMILTMTTVLVAMSHFELLHFALIPMLAFYFAGRYAGKKN